MASKVLSYLLGSASSLHRAAWSGDVKKVREILQHKYCTVNCRDIHNITPLHYACARGHLGVVKVLISEYNADMIAEDKVYGITPLNLATGNVLEYMIQILSKYKCADDVKETDSNTVLHYACALGDVDLVRTLIKEYSVHVNLTNNKKNTPLHIAALHGNQEVVLALINEFGCDPNIRGFESISLLSFAAMGGNADLVQILIRKHKSDVNDKNNYGNTPVYLAALHGHAEVTLTLINEFGCDPDIRGYDGNSLLCSAAMGGNADLVRILIQKHKADVKDKNNDGNTPVHLAALCGHAEVTLTLINEFGCDPDIRGYEGNSLLCSAAMGGNTDLVRTLIQKHKADVKDKNNSGNTPVHLAALYGHAEVTLTLINEFGCDPDIRGYEGKSLLSYAAMGGNTDLVRTLIQKYQADVNDKDNNVNTPVHLAAWKGHTEVTLALIKEFGCDPDIRGYEGKSLLSYVAMGGNTDLVRTLIQKYQADVNDKDNNGDTPVHLAAWQGHAEVTLSLINEFGCDPDIRGYEGSSLLSSAAMGGNTDLVRTLIQKYQADVNDKDNNGNTPVHLAAWKGHAEVTLTLINEFGCDPDIRGYEGKSLLIFAAMGGSIDLVQTLIENNEADVNYRDNNGKTPVDYAIAYKHNDLELFLQRKTTELEGNKEDTADKNEDKPTMVNDDIMKSNENKVSVSNDLMEESKDKEKEEETVMEEEVKDTETGGKMNKKLAHDEGNLLQEIKDKEEEEAELVKEIEDAVDKNDGMIDRKLAHIMFVGLPGSGKSSLMHRLLGKLRKKFSTSTGVCDTLVIVDIDVSNPADFFSATVVDNTWEETECDASFIRQMREGKEEKEENISYRTGRYNFQLGETQPIQIGTTDGQRSSMTSTPAETKLSSFLDMTRYPRADLGKDETKFKNFSSSVNKITGTHFKESVQSVLKKHGAKKFKKYLKKTCSIYLRDTGGQVEFQEMLALLISGPSIFIFVFRADLDLKNKFKIEYIKSSSESLNSYTSSITTEEALLQCLASVHAMDTSSKDKVKTHQPLVFIVGTHIDKLGSEREVKISSLNKHLDDIIKSNGFNHLVQYADELKNHVMFAVDNTSESENSFQLIRSRVNILIVNSSEFSIEYPISYLLFCLDLQNIKKSVLTLEECHQLAADHGIMGDQVLHLLHFLHLRIGLIRYYDVEGLRHLVIIEPQVLFNKTTYLIAMTFSSGLLFPGQVTDLKKGILTESALENVFSFSDTNKISPREFLLLLVHLRITAPFHVAGNKEKIKYFIPCVINHIPESTEETETDIATLCVKFKCNHCPKGIFGVLVTYLMQQEGDNYDTKFNLQEDKIFKDQVSFEVQSLGVLDEIVIKLLSSHLEIVFFPGLSDDRDTSVNEVCNNVRLIIEKSIMKSLKDLHYKEDNVKPLMCFKCEHCSQLHEIIKGKEHYKISCRKSRKTSRIPPNGRCWYNEDIDTDVPQASSEKLNSTCVAASSGEFTLRNIAVALKDLSPDKYLCLALELKLTKTSVDKHKKNNPGDTEQVLMEILHEWMISADSASWDTLRMALEVVQPNLAKTI